MEKQKEILVLGAGVSGLSSGVLLLKSGYKVHIWAKDLPPYTTSNIAAAVWYPYLCEPKDKVTGWSGLTLEYLKQYVVADSASGCIKRTVTELFDKKVGDPWWEDAVKTHRRPTTAELPLGYVDAYQVESIVMDNTKYMGWLLETYKKLGGTLEQKVVENVNELSGDHTAIVNCTGFGAIELFGDNSVYAVRGQVVVVKPNGFDQVVADNEAHNGLMYIIPRLNDIVLGGTAQANDWNLKIDPKDTADILRKAQAISPKFAKVEIIEEKVGLRPARDKIRLELEMINGKPVIHNYGHGGSGFTLSWGCAQEVVELVEAI
jgi:D-amino-acid oxidase